MSFLTQTLTLTPPPFRRCLSLALLTTGLCTSHNVWADAAIDALTDPAPPVGTAGLGFSAKGEASPYVGAGARLDVVPLYIYEGERVFLRANRVGIKALANDDQRLELFLEKRLEGFPIRKQPAELAGMAQRTSANDFGLSYSYRQPWGTLKAELAVDAGDTHNGSEARLGYSYNWRSGALSLRPAVSVAFRSARLNDYYYGVKPGEATASRPAYTAGAGVNAAVGLYGVYDLSRHWQVLAGVSATVLGSQAANSPIVEKRVLPAVYLGASYAFEGRKPAPAEASSPTYFKVLYGKANAEGCHLAKIITLRCLKTDKNYPTAVAGIQVGKPFAQNFNDWPIDLVGYAGLTHHDDKGFGPNGLQLDVFMKGYYHGFPWSQRVKTRLGLGIGASLAQRVPYSEYGATSTPGQPTSKLLNYLDPTIDFSVGDALGMRSLKNTYLGIGVSHRSGIFGASRLLGNVNSGSGSNYIYTYLETAL